MEPEGIGSVLGAVIAAVGGFAEPAPTKVDIFADAPQEFRPLRFVAAGRLIDVHPGQIEDVRLDHNHYGQLALQLRFGAEISEWIAGSTGMNVGRTMPILICEQELLAPIIQEPILGGNVMLSGNLDAEEMYAAMLIIAGQVDCEGRPIDGAESAGSENGRKGGRP